MCSPGGWQGGSFVNANHLWRELMAVDKPWLKLFPILFLRLKASNSCWEGLNKSHAARRTWSGLLLPLCFLQLQPHKNRFYACLWLCNEWGIAVKLLPSGNDANQWKRAWHATGARAFDTTLARSVRLETLGQKQIILVRGDVGVFTTNAEWWLGIKSDLASRVNKYFHLINAVFRPPEKSCLGRFPYRFSVYSS